MHTDHPFTEKQDVFQLPDFAAGPYSVICDFDGTVTPFDVTDAIGKGFSCLELEWHKPGVRKNYKSEKSAGQVRACTNRRGWTSLTGILKAVQDPRYPYASGPSSGPVDGAVPLNKRFDTTIRRKVDQQVFQRGNTCGLPARQVVKDY